MTEIKEVDDNRMQEVDEACVLSACNPHRDSSARRHTRQDLNVSNSNTVQNLYAFVSQSLGDPTSTTGPTNFNPEPDLRHRSVTAEP